MLADMGADEFLGWIRFGNAEPFGDERADWRQALTTLAVVKAWGGNTSAKLSDFMLRPATSGGQSTEQMRAIAEQAAAAFQRTHDRQLEKKRTRDQAARKV